MPENHCCLVPVFDILGPCSVELMEHWAKSEGVELRRMWDDRLAVSVDDARMVYDRAMAAAEAARRKRLRVSGDGYT